MRLPATVLAAAILCCGHAANLAAQEPGGGVRDRTMHASAYVGRWAEARFLEVTPRLVAGQLETRQSNFAGGGLGAVLVPRFEVPLPLCGGCALRGNSVELEGVLLKHFDRQDHWEVAGGAFVRTGQVPLVLGTELNLAGGAGLSYALGDPDLESGRGGRRGIDTYRLQFYLALETELAHAAVSGWSLVGRVHHRSGGYGTLSPSGSGSNFVGLGLRRGF